MVKPPEDIRDWYKARSRHNRIKYFIIDYLTGIGVVLITCLILFYLLERLK
jgi:hypothetical protein